MKLTVLMDNNTLIDRYFLAEPGVSYLIEEGETKILFDTGYSDAFIVNARKMAVSLLDLDYIVLSHGHLDHTWGLVPLMRLYTEALIEGLTVKKPTLIAHPNVFLPRSVDGIPEIGTLLSEQFISRFFTTVPTRDPYHLTDTCVFLGEIDRTNDFESQTPIGTITNGDVTEPDFIMDDSALAVTTDEGLVIITGCAHAGICNILEAAMTITGDRRIHDIIGGFHLLDPSQKQLSRTIDYLGERTPRTVHACHCTDLRSKIALARTLPIEEVGAGMTIEY